MPWAGKQVGQTLLLALALTETMICGHAAVLEGCCLLQVTFGGWCTIDAPVTRSPVADLWT